VLGLHVIATANKFCEHYFCILEPKQSINDKATDQWQPTLKASIHTKERALWMAT